MIDHNRQLIFVHIARCGGTSIEQACIGQDMWYSNPHEKHIPAQIARKIYQPYWKDYYKFALVRNPFERFRSLYSYADHYGLYLNSNKEIELDQYLKKFGYPAVLERSLNSVERWHRKPIQLFDPKDIKYYPECLYANLLVPELAIFKLEEMSALIRVLNFYNVKKIEKVEISIEKPHLSDRSVSFIREIQKQDFEYFGYSTKYVRD